MESYGIGPGEVPYHRFGSGSESLFVLPGVMDSLGWNRPSRVTRELLARFYFREFKTFDTWVTSRPVGLQEAESVRQMAQRYVPLLEQAGGGHVLGFTLGGAVAVHLAATHPRLVDRLVLVACGTRLGLRGERILRRWRTLAQRKNWRALHVDYAKTMYTGTYRRLVPSLYRLCHPLLPRPEKPDDVRVSCDALLEYDGSTVLGDIEAETLVVADTEGPLFPETLQHDAARRVEDGYVGTIPGGHAVYEQSRRAFADVVTRFLGGQQTR